MMCFFSILRNSQLEFVVTLNLSNKYFIRNLVKAQLVTDNYISEDDDTFSDGLLWLKHIQTDGSSPPQYDVTI